MSKPTKSVIQWLSDKFGSSHKAISENLSTEQYNQFLTEAENVIAAEDSDDDDDDDDQDDIQNLDPAPTPTSGTLSIEDRIKALESTLSTSQSALKSEQGKNKSLTKKLGDTQAKLEASEAQKTKLRQAVNPLGDEDITNAEPGVANLTKADVEARASFKANRSEA